MGNLFSLLQQLEKDESSDAHRQPDGLGEVSALSYHIMSMEDDGDRKSRVGYGFRYFAANGSIVCLHRLRRKTVTVADFEMDLAQAARDGLQ